MSYDYVLDYIEAIRESDVNYLIKQLVQELHEKNLCPIFKNGEWSFRKIGGKP